MISPNRAVFRHAFNACLKSGIDTYDHLPDASKHYPFAFVGESNDVPVDNLDPYGEVRQTIHFYGLLDQETQLDRHSVLTQAWFYEEPRGFGYQLSPIRFNQQRIPDNSTGTHLTHLVLDVTFLWTRKE